MTDFAPNPHWSATEIAAAPGIRFRHPLNPRSDVRLCALGDAAGLTRIGLSLARLSPNRESFLYHSYERAEEFVYILSGRGMAEIGEETLEVGPGDFMGFTAPGPAHHLINPFDEDLVYLTGGERVDFEVGRFPRIGRTSIMVGGQVLLAENETLVPMRVEDALGE
jgi:uncharacterized cupin superfamily protein